MNPKTHGTENSASPFAKPVTAPRYAIFFAIALVGLTLDLATKQIIFGRHFDKDATFAAEPVWLVEPWLGIQTSTNQGALFGMGQGWTGLFASLSVVAFAVLIYLLFFCRWANDLFITVTFAMIAAGIFGNLYDRLGFWHDADISIGHRNAVRDWIYFNWENGPAFMNPWPNFNIADCLLVCGAILLCIHAFFIQPKMEAAFQAEEKKSAESSAAKS